MNDITFEFMWRVDPKREFMVSRIEETIHLSNVFTLKNAVEMEQQIYDKSHNKDEYFAFVTRLVKLIRECGKHMAEYQDCPSYTDIEPTFIDPLSEIPELVARGPCEGDQRERRRQVESAIELGMKIPSFRSGSMLTPEGRSQQSEKYKGEYSWRTPAFRKSIVAKFDNAAEIFEKPSPKNVMLLEQMIFDKAKTREEYGEYAKRVLIYLQEMSTRAEERKNEKGQKPDNDISDLIPGSYTAFLDCNTGRRFKHYQSFSTSYRAQFLTRRVPPRPSAGGG